MSTKLPFLIDPSEERTRPPGVDGTALAWPFLILEQWLPRRLRPMPPFFIAVAGTGLLWGVLLPICSIGGLPSGGVNGQPVPAPLGTVLDLLAFAAAAAGVVQGLGHWARRPWGFTAAIVWLSLCGILGILLQVAAADGEAREPATLIASVLSVGWFAALMVYYSRRRGWFGTDPSRRERPSPQSH